MLTLDRLLLVQGDFRLAANFTVPPGMTAVIGPSGGGKSTLLSAIAGFLQPAAGRVLWDKVSLNGAPPGDRPVTILFQDNNLFPHLTAAQNVGLALAPRLRLTQAQSAQVEGALAQVGLSGLGSSKPAALSGGQQSRAALARALLANRPTVLLDEAFAALGPALRHDMLTLVRDKLAASGKTVIFVTHDPADAQRMASHVIVAAEGVAHAPAETGPLFADPPRALRQYLRAT